MPPPPEKITTLDLMVHIFFAWWLRQLSALLPQAFRPATADGSAPEDVADSVLLALAPTRPGQPAALEAARRRRQRLIPLGRFGLDTTGLAALRAAIGTGRHGPIRLVLPPALLLEQPVTLPLAAERGLDSALRWEMDRLTPFTADAVFWTWRIVQRDRIRSQLTLRLILVAKSAVEASVDALAAAGLAPAASRPPASPPAPSRSPARAAPRPAAPL